MNKIFAVGDIHGQLTMLKDLVSKINYESQDTLIFIGDYIDRGEDSKGVIDYLIQLQKIYNCIFLKGNHEEMLMDYLSGINKNLYLYNGGAKTMKDYGPMGVPNNHMDFFRNLKNYHETEDYIFVHAGLWINNETALDKLPNDIILWVRDEFILSKCDYGKKVIFGHTPFNNPKVMDNKIGIDTGAVFGRKLTCLVLPDETFIQVP